MTTARRITTNRQNARRSTGPRMGLGLGERDNLCRSNPIEAPSLPSQPPHLDVDSTLQYTPWTPRYRA